MKRIITVFSMLAFLTLSVQAQLTRTNPGIFKEAVPVTEQFKNGNERIDIPKGSYLKTPASIPSYGDTVGYTWYDYQSNAGMQNRIYEDANGNIQVIWTKAVDTIRDPGNALRGIGYNYYDAGTQTWIPGDSNNAAFGLADKRVGWPSIANTDGTDEYIFAHTNRLYTSTKGASAVNTVDLTGVLNDGTLFYHSTGQGNSIYVAYDNGGFFSFARSDDGGSTWAIADFSIDSATSTFLRPIATDGWDLDVKGDTVAIVTGGHAAFTGVDPNDVVLFLSADRGATWSAQTIHVFDTVNAELDTASGGYIVETPHADVRVLIGADGRIHCGGSIMATLTDPGAFTSSSWFPLARGIWYWNSDMPAGFDVNDPADYATYVLVDSVPDLTTMGSYPTASADQGNYVTGSFSHPSLSEDANGNLYIVYSGICAGSDNNPFDNRFRRDLFAMKSGDGGMNWSTSKNIASLLFANDVTDGTVGEEAYPVTPKRVQSDIKILFQHDSWAGPTLTDDQPILEQNKMAVLSLDPALISGIEEEISKESLNIYPNPASGTATVTFESNVKGNTNVVVSNMIGQTVKVVKAEIVKGSNTVVLNLSDVNEGIYLVTLGTGSNKITQKLVIE